MRDIVYYSPKTIAETLQLLQEYGNRARLFCGGTDTLVRFQKGVLPCDALVDTKRISDMSNQITQDNHNISIGSRVTLDVLITDNIITEHFPALQAAASTVGSVQIRNRATLTGNICNASPAADTIPALMVYGATVHIISNSGTRAIPIESFFVGPGKTVCQSTEMVTAITLPIPKQPHEAAFNRLTRRRGVDLAVVNTACAIDAHGSVTFSLGAAGPTPVVVKSSDPIFTNPQATEETLTQKIREMTDKGKPITDIRSGEEYRREMLFHISWQAFSQARTAYLNRQA
jgi:carbon-monoxide dehydrogenase medium subunit